MPLDKSQRPKVHHSLSPREHLLLQAGPLLQWLHSPQGVVFNDWLRNVRLRENKNLMEGKELEMVFRAQGSVGILDLILGLEEDLHQYQEDVREGRCQPIKEIV